jgi:DNA primase
MEKKSRVYSILNQVISRGGIEAKGPELIFYCPFCDHYKRKLQVNVDSQNWHCWVCDAKGRSVFSLVKKIGVTKSVFTELSQIYNTYTETYGTNIQARIGNLPKQFQTLIGNGESVVFLHAKKYLLSRGITEEDIIKYNIGFCIDGDYGGRIIVPSYDANSNLNYFVGRSIYPGKLKYKNPPASKDIVAFELYINWNEPVVLCEGVFDAIAIKRNAIPLLGKTISQTLLQRLVHNKVPEIILALDADALDTSIKISQRLMRYGLKVSRIVLADKDPSELGFKKMRKEVLNRIPVDHYELILQRIASASI